MRLLKISFYVSDFHNFLKKLGKVREIEPDMYKVLTEFTSDEIKLKFLSLVTSDFFEEFPYEPPVSAGEKAYLKCKDCEVFLAVEGWSSSCAESLPSPTPENAKIAGIRIIGRWMQNLGNYWQNVVSDSFDSESFQTYLMAKKV